MNNEDFTFLTRLVKDRSGITLGPDKVYLLDARLQPLLRNNGAADVGDLCRRLRSGRDSALASAVVEAMTTNESFFFRDGAPFSAFREFLHGSLLKSRESSRRLRIWSAACSTGQEPYSLAMLLAEDAARLSGWQVDIIATDLSRAALARAEAGAYNEFEINRGLPRPLRDRYFTSDGLTWTVKPDLRQRVQFRNFNLLDDPRSLGGFDVVFCRNVLIYFDEATKRQVLANIRSVLAADGILFLGGSESLLGTVNMPARTAANASYYPSTYLAAVNA